MKIINKKLRKFLRDPGLYFKDMYLKRSRKITSLTPKKHIGNFQYTVLSAVYNVEKYLDAYFRSLVEQRLDFEKNIYLILVDDGSIDGSAKIIKYWQQKFPENIQYIYKENGGQASARNLGLDHVKTEWITFIDPDDFVDLNYFLEADNFLKKYEDNNIKLLSCNFIFFHEDKNQFSDTHPLKYRYAKGDCVMPVRDLGKHVQLSVNSALFRREIIENAGLRSDPRIRPNFEDAHFVGAYLAELSDGSVGFSKSSRYYYRKRSDGSSTLDTAWQNKMLFAEVLQYGCLDIMERHISRHGVVPKHIQRTVLYHLIWYIKRIVNRPESVNFLDNEQKSSFLHMVKKLFSYIDEDTITNFELAGSWFFHKIGMLGAFKGQEPPFQIAYIEDYDSIKSQVLIRYFTRQVALEVFRLGGVEILPAFAKTMRHDFIDTTFVLERRLWIPLPLGQDSQLLTIQIGSQKARVTLAAKQHPNGMSKASIIKHFSPKQPKASLLPLYTDAWLLMDRDTQADDNAEHLYRYISQTHPEQRIYFVLRQESHDWSRLKAEGFNLLDFGSVNHEAALHACKKIISSHIDQYVVDYFKNGSLNDKHIVFLQHGVIQNDLSFWLNSKKRIDCFVTAALPEFMSISEDFNRYKYTKKEVVLTGLPRHDVLLQRQVSMPIERLVIIMPTWRKDILGIAISGNKREINPEFMLTEYAERWNAFLHNQRLEKVARLHNYKIMFFPHPNIKPYLPQFNLPEWIEVLNHSGGGIQEYFARAALMITDYSSVAFDFSYLNKPVIYYQFDEEAFFSGAHTSQRGYFDYRNNGFGPVCLEEENLIDEVENLLVNNTVPDQKYLERIDSFFPTRDGRNCERVYESIGALDQPMTECAVDWDILVDYAHAASHAKEWLLAKSRWRAVLNFAEAHAMPEMVIQAQMHLIPVLRHTRRLVEARQLIDEIQSVQCDALAVGCAIDVQYESALLAMDAHDWFMAINILGQLPQSEEVRYQLLQCYAQAGEINAITQMAAESSDANLETEPWLAVAQGDWSRIVELLTETPETLSEDKILRLLLARAYRELANLSLARVELVCYSKELGKDRYWTCELGRLLVAESRWKDAISFFAQSFPEGVPAMSVNDGLMLVKARRMSGNLVMANAELKMLENKYPASAGFILEKAELAEGLADWGAAAEHWHLLINQNAEAAYREAEALRKIGKTSNALFVLKHSNAPAPKTLEQRLLRAELAHLEGDYSDAVDNWTGLLRHFPNEAPKYVWERLGEARMMIAVKQYSKKH